jgi:hypothetical protein
VDVRSVALPDRAKLTARWDAGLLGGAMVIEGSALAPRLTGWKGRLYRPAGEAKARTVRLKAVPYCLWDHREAGTMAVWLPRG